MLMDNHPYEHEQADERALQLMIAEPNLVASRHPRPLPPSPVEFVIGCVCVCMCMKESGQERLAHLATRCSCDGRTLVLFSKRSVKSNGRRGRRLSPPRADIKEYFRHGHVLLPRKGGGLSTTPTSSIPPRSRKSQSPIHDDLMMDQRGPTIDSLGDPWESRSSRCTPFDLPRIPALNVLPVDPTRGEKSR